MNEFSLAGYVKNNFDGMLIIGDVHSDLEALTKACEFAKAEHYFLMSLGDLVDRGNHPYECVELMYRAVYNGHAGFTVGNHDHKFRRFHAGNKVRFSKDAERTIELVGEERMDSFMTMYVAIMDDPMLSSTYHTFDDLILAHAASHPAMWDGNEKFGKSAQARAYVGETNGEIHEDGYPVRLYNWIDEIPMGKTVIVGHDRMPIHNVPITEPLVKSNTNGGKAIFMDTGCGKSGFLSGALVVSEKKKFKLDRFIDFK